jgi:hypothetical protein
MITGNTIRDVAAVVEGHAVQIHSSNNVTVAENLIQKTPGSAGLCQYGVVIATSGNYMSVINNNFIGIINPFADTVTCKVRTISGNLGFVTENYGLASVTGGGTTVTVSHGLAGIVPTIVLVTANTTGCGNFSVGSFAWNTFTITFTNAPGGSTWGFYWYAKWT